MRGNEVAELTQELRQATDMVAYLTATLNAHKGLATTVGEVAFRLVQDGQTDFSDPLIEALGDLAARMNEVTL
jgi:hypothetical protein